MLFVNTSTANFNVLMDLIIVLPYFNNHIAEFVSDKLFNFKVQKFNKAYIIY